MMLKFWTFNFLYLGKAKTRRFQTPVGLVKKSLKVKKSKNEPSFFKNSREMEKKLCNRVYL